MTDGYISQEDAIRKVLLEKYAGEETADFSRDREKMLSGEPWQYVLGHVTFLDCTVDLSCRPMIPRPETAAWTQRVIEEWKEKGPIAALDLYAGSGNIGLALLKHLPESHVTFSELDAALLPGIQRSIDLLDDGHRKSIMRATLLAGDSLEQLTGTFDVICANPPYIDPAHEQDLDPEQHHEPHIAFFGSADGMGHARELIEKGKRYLNPGGAIYCECDNEQVPILKDVLKNTDWVYEFWHDPYGNDGVMVLRMVK